MENLEKLFAIHFAPITLFILTSTTIFFLFLCVATLEKWLVIVQFRDEIHFFFRNSNN